MTVETHIGQYKILKTLGAGGMGTVYLGEHLLLGRRAAIKTLLPALSSHREIVDRFFNEARAISAISDPGVVQIFDFGYHVDGTAYIVMEYLEGESLAARLDRLGRLPVVVALRLARQIAHSLGAAHARGIIHRDLKPGNVFLIHDPEAQGGERTKILDFGICKLSDAEGTVTQTGTMIGTPVYMSPEQCRGNGRIDHRSDIYSVGCALYHMLTGHPPFRCDSVGDFIAAHLKEEPPPPSEMVSGLPIGVDAVVMRCLEKSPANRFQTMGELHVTIERVLATISDHQVSSAVPMSPQTPLGEGFRSAFNVNVNSLPTMDEWFVDSQAPVTAVPITDEWATTPRLGWAKRLALAAALFVGVAGGLLGTNYAIKEEPVAAAPLPTEPTVAASEEPQLEVPATATAQEAMPTEVVTKATESIAAAEPEPPPVAAVTQDVPKTIRKPARPPRPHTKKPPRPRRIVPEEPDEDLYEMR